ncbi:MAG: hypothetical protein AB7H43_03800 [Acidimicrobiia bacterium]
MLQTDGVGVNRTVASAVAVAALVAGCGGDDDGGASSRSSTTSTTWARTPVTEPVGSVGDSDATGRSELEDGRHFGFWRTFEIGDTIAYGEFDLAYFLTGEEAEAEAAARGDEVNNDYYVVNDNPKLRTLIARGSTTVRVLVGGGATLTSSNVADFAVERHEGSGCWVTIEGGIVTEIEEQFVP